MKQRNREIEIIYWWKKIPPDKYNQKVSKYIDL